YFDFKDVANMVAVASGYAFPVIIRISEVQREFVLKYLDIGAEGFLLSTTSSPEQIAKLVDYCKYPPRGHRGISLQRAHKNYQPGNVKEYLEYANDRTVVLAQIESREGALRSAEIAAVPGVDGMLIGPNDMCMDLGKVGATSDPEVVSAFEMSIKAFQDAGKAAGMISSNIAFLKQWQQKGLKLVNWNSEIGMLLNEGKRGLKELRD
nr:hypothetical protein [Clostridium sp.]